MDTREVARLLGKSEWWVRSNRALLQIPAYKVGDQWRFREEEVIEWLEMRRVVT